MKVRCQNVQAVPPMPQGDVVEDVTTAADDVGLIGWQEVERSRYEAAVADLDADTWRTFGLSHKGGVPITWRRDWFAFVDGGSILLHRATPGVCREKRVVWVLLRHRRSGVELLANNAHYVSKAWSTTGLAGRLRRRMWYRGRRRHLELIDRWATRGVPIVGTGDFNRRRSLRGDPFGVIAGRHVAYHTPPASIDYVWTLDGSEALWVEVETETRDDVHSDHRGRWARLLLRPRGGK